MEDKPFDNVQILHIIYILQEPWLEEIVLYLLRGNHLKPRCSGCKDGWVLKNSGCSSRRSQFESQQPDISSVVPVLWD